MFINVMTLSYITTHVTIYNLFAESICCKYMFGHFHKYFFLEFSTAYIPISRAAWFTVAFTSPNESILVKMEIWGPIPMLYCQWYWKVCLLNKPLFRWSYSMIGDVSMIGSRASMTRGVRTLDCNVLTFL